MSLLRTEGILFQAFDFKQDLEPQLLAFRLISAYCSVLALVR